MTLIDSFKGSIICGAIGDAWGSAYENLPPKKDTSTTYYPFGKMPIPKRKWKFTDDTQLTLATCEAISSKGSVCPKIIAETFVKYFREKKITGVGASTLKALRELNLGAHWSQVGRKGTYAAGNGAAMRIAPLAFCQNVSKKQIYDVCSITHHNAEAYAGALAIYYAVKKMKNKQLNPSFLKTIATALPDTLVKDRILEINKNYKNQSISTVAKIGNDGYVVNSVPLAIFSASKIKKNNIENIFKEIIDSGGDTDTNASMAGQIMGTYIGYSTVPHRLIQKIQKLKGFLWGTSIIEGFINSKNWR